MKHFLYILIAATLCLSVSCDNNIDFDEVPYDSELAITWNVVSPSVEKPKYVSRAMIENDNLLQLACSEGNQAIGVWSAHEIDGVVTKNVLGNDNGDVALVYQPQTSWDNYEGWTYGENAARWELGAAYTFNAYFPMNVVTEIVTSDLSTFVLEHNTEIYQEDLMVAYSYIDTDLPTFKLGVPVTLNMLHTLSALRFQFSFIDSDGTTYDDSDALTAFWLENTAYDAGIATTGMLAFGTYDDEGVMDGEHIHWYYEDYPEPSTSLQPRRIYPWEDANGIPFASTATQRTIASAYTTDADGMQKYAHNDGYIMVIPQVTDGSTMLCFSLQSTGNLVHRIPLPTTTFEAGKRYTYDIRFGRTESTVLLSIAEWNELKSSQDIPL